MTASSIRGEWRAPTGHTSGSTTTTSDPRTTTVTADDVARVHQLFAASVSVGSGLEGHQHPRGGPRAGRGHHSSYLQTTTTDDFDVRWAQAWLARAQTFDDGTLLVPAAVMCRGGGGSTAGATAATTAGRSRPQQSQQQYFQRRLLLHSESVSGYTPLHTALFGRNLAALLLFVRQASSAEEKETGTRGGRWWTPHRSLMHLLHPTTTTITDKNSTKNTSLLRAMTTAQDHEGLTPGQLLGKLQRSELLQCRQSLASFHTLPPAVENIGNNAAASRDQNSEDNSDDDNDNNDAETTTTTNNNIENHKDRNVSYACEVVTFGRPQHCALGVIQGTSSSSHLSKTESNFCCPHRVSHFAQEAVGRHGAAIAVAAATHHTLVVTTAGAVYACGVDNGGRLGLGDQQPQQCPLFRRVLGPLHRQHVRRIAAAENHSLCVTTRGAVYAWGSNRFGQLDGRSSGTCGSSSLPRRVADLHQHPCVTVAAGAQHSVALSTLGEVFVWGDNSAGKLGVPSRSGTSIYKVQRVEGLWSSSSSASSTPKVAIAIAAAEHSTLALIGANSSSGMTQVNTVYEFGHGNHVPIRIHFDASSTTAGAKTSTPSVSFSSRGQRRVNPTGIACARYHNAAITSEGFVYTWGLRAESLGRDNNCTASSSPKTAHPQRRNSVPHLVTGMLPERGGGLAVAIAASDSHTAVLCDDGALYTWGTTNENNVLGHAGVRWQPNPKRVPGVHRAVSVAVAKEHTVLLIGTSLPPLPNTDRSCSLAQIAASKVAEYVDIFNILPMMIMAERTQSQLLISYCSDFMQRNFDGVINYAKMKDMNQYLNAMLAESTSRTERRFRDDRQHPFIFDLLAAGSNRRSSIFDRDYLSDNLEWIRGCKQLSKSATVQRLLARANVREYGEDQNASTISTEHHWTTKDDAVVKESHLDRCMKRVAKMDLSTIEQVNENSIWLSKDIRGIRKKLKQISNLNDAGIALSTEQMVKINRRPDLEAELSVYESAVVEIDRRIQRFADEKRKKDLPVDKDDAKHGLIDKETDNHCSKVVVNEEKDKNEPKSYFCNLCRVKCSDKQSLFLHRNGRKHRNRAAQVVEEEKEKTAATIRSQRQIEQIKSAPILATPSKKNNKSAWGTPSQPHYKLPPPPHPVLSPVASPQFKNKIARSISQNDSSSKMTKKSLYLGANQHPMKPNRRKSLKSVVSSPSFHSTPRPCNFTAILKEQEKSSNSNNKFSADSSPSSFRCVSQPLYDDSSTKFTGKSAGSSQRTKNVSLADFLLPSRKKQMPALASFPGIASAPWSKTESVVVNVEDKTTAAAVGEVNSGRSILQIQAEEASLKANQDKSYGNGGGSWYVERRERAESVAKIQRNAKEELQYRLMVEEQIEIEAQIREENRRIQNTNGKQKNNKKGTCKRRNNSKRIEKNNKNTNK